MTDKERLEEIKKELELDWSDISYVVNQFDVKWLINRVEELEIQLSINTNNMKQLQKENERYKQALEFYADEETYEPLEVQIGAVTKEGYKISKYKYDPIINTDKGKKARETLGWEEGK